MELVLHHFILQILNITCTKVYQNGQSLYLFPFKKQPNINFFHLKLILLHYFSSHSQATFCIMDENLELH